MPMEAEDLPQAFRMILQRRGWTVKRLAGELGMSWTWVYAVLRGDRSPSMATAARLLDRVGWEIRISPKNDRGDDVRRRKFIAAAASVAFVPPPKTTPFHDPEYVRLLAQRATRVRDETGGASAAGWVMRHAKSIETASVNANPQLYAAASWFMRRAAYVVLNAGRIDLAERLAGDALTHADRGDDPSQRAAARATLASIYIRKGNDGLAAMHAQRGLEIAAITDENRAWLSVNIGRALSRIPGRERDSRAAIDSALAIDDLSAIDKVDLMGCTGLALHNVGADRKAYSALSEAVALSANQSVFLQTAYIRDQATIALDTKDLSRAALHMRELSYLAPLTDSRSIDSGIGRVLASSARWARVPEIRQAREQLRSVLPERT